MELPKDPVILLSFVNTQLRDACPSLEIFCERYGISAEELTGKMETIDYRYDKETNQFI